jgi:hypothetical protein
MTPRLANLRAKLDRLRTVDTQHRVFGAKRAGKHGHEYREQPALDAEGLSQLEAECGATLPDDMRDFLANVHSGGPGPGYGLEIWGEPAKAKRPFPFALADFDDVLARRQKEQSPFLPMSDEDDEDDDCWPPGSGFVALVQHGCGVFDVVIVTGDLRGSVWCCDMAWRPYDTDGRPSTFLDWYESWLDRNLSPSALARLQTP